MTFPDSDFPGVQRVLQDYYDGLYHLDVDKLRQVFSPSARYATAWSGELLELGVEDYLARLPERTPPASTGTPYGYTVHSLTFAGSSAAVAELHCSLFGYDYVDLLTLLFVDGQWRIQCKVFHATPWADPSSP